MMCLTVRFVSRWYYQKGCWGWCQTHARRKRGKCPSLTHSCYPIPLPPASGSLFCHFSLLRLACHRL